MGRGLDSTIIAAGVAFPVCTEAELTVKGWECSEGCPAEGESQCGAREGHSIPGIRNEPG